VDALVEADALREKCDWVLPEEAVEDGDLTDLMNCQYELFV
jgi:hypothetical protein